MLKICLFSNHSSLCFLSCDHFRFTGHHSHYSLNQFVFSFWFPTLYFSVLKKITLHCRSRRDDVLWVWKCHFLLQAQQSWGSCQNQSGFQVEFTKSACFQGSVCCSIISSNPHSSWHKLIACTHMIPFRVVQSRWCQSGIANWVPVLSEACQAPLLHFQLHSSSGRTFPAQPSEARESKPPGEHCPKDVPRDLENINVWKALDFL